MFGSYTKMCKSQSNTPLQQLGRATLRYCCLGLQLPFLALPPFLFSTQVEAFTPFAWCDIFLFLHSLFLGGLELSYFFVLIVVSSLTEVLFLLSFFFVVDACFVDLTPFFLGIFVCFPVARFFFLFLHCGLVAGVIPIFCHPCQHNAQSTLSHLLGRTKDNPPVSTDS